MLLLRNEKAAVGKSLVSLTVPSWRRKPLEPPYQEESVIMITKFSSLFAGHIDLGEMGEDTTPVNERFYSNEDLATRRGVRYFFPRTSHRTGYKVREHNPPVWEY